MNSPVSPDLLRQLINYDPETGLMTWRKRDVSLFRNKIHSAKASCNNWNSKFAGKPALNAVQATGYRHGIIMGRHYKAHRVAWAIYYGEWPEGQIDHINHYKLDNRISNLRIVDHGLNQKNASLRTDNKSGVPGVGWDKATGKWRAWVSSRGRQIHLGLHEHFEVAVAARKAAQRELGYHDNHGAQKMTVHSERAFSRAMIASPFGNDPIAPEDAFTNLKSVITPSVKARADAEWAAMDERGHLPEGWPNSQQVIDTAAEALTALGLTKKLATAVVNEVAAGNVPGMKVVF